MDVFLIRHAHAGQRTFGLHDRYRPLSDEGRLQADELAAFFSTSSSGGLSAIYSSPATRCVQTMEPSAQAAGLEITEQEDLWEDAGLDDAMVAIEQACRVLTDSEAVAFCSHGNLIPAIVERLGHLGIVINGRGCERASVWRLHRRQGQWERAQYLTPRSAYRP